MRRIDNSLCEFIVDYHSLGGEVSKEHIMLKLNTVADHRENARVAEASNYRVDVLLKPNFSKVSFAPRINFTVVDQIAVLCNHLMRERS